MNAKDLAGKLDGMEYPVRIPRELAAAAKAAGLVIVYGAGNDLMEFEGAIHDALSAYEGTTVRVDSAGLLPERSEIEDDEELKRFFERESQAREIEAVWGDDPNSPIWTYRTSIPHETFNVMEDGEIYCVGIVFSQAALTQPEQPEAGRDLAAHIAEAIDKERFEIVTADLYRKALEEVIRDALKTFRPQAQEANAEAVELLARLVAIANERPFAPLGHVLEHEVPAAKILVGNSAAAQEGL